MSVQFKSFQEILGDMIRKLMAVTGVNDLNKGSVLMTLLEASAQEDFSQYGALIEVLDNYSLDNTSGADLDKRAAEYNLTRLAATRASGFITISDSTMSKVSTGIYIGASPPIAGDNVIKVDDASDITFPGSIYIGRSTPNFEGPIALKNPTLVPGGQNPIDNGSYWEIHLAVPLTKNHNLNETVVLAQKGDRGISAGTLVRIPSNNISSAISFKVVNDQILADGEEILNNILVFATVIGSTGNAPLQSISEFEILPFTGAIVTNHTSFSNARDLETDQELRDRIKNEIQSLPRGVRQAILSGVIGVTDPDDNKRVASASLIEPTLVTDIAQLFIDDGIGFEPSYSGQGLENLILDAAGTEEFLQLGNFPLVKAQVESENAQPYSIPHGSTLLVRVDDVEETITFLSSDFVNTSSAKALEVVEAINDRATTFEARTTNSQKNVVIFSTTLNNEKIQVSGGTANDALLFSTDPVYTLRLYKNDNILTKDGVTAFVESDNFGNWNPLVPPATFNIQVDGKPPQYIKLDDNSLEVSVSGGAGTYVAFLGTTFNDLGTSLINASLSQWATILDQVISGAEVIVNGSKLKITSNQENTTDSKIQILDGGTTNNLISGQGWSTDLVTGQASDFTLNRFNGQIELSTPLVAGDDVTAGTRNTRGSVLSAVFAGGTIDFSLDFGRTPDLYVVVDGVVVKRIMNAPSGSTMTVAASGSDWRYTSSVAAFTDLFVGDYVVVQQQTVNAWVGAVNTGIFRVEAVDSSGFWFEVNNPNGAAGGPSAVDDAGDIQAFSSSRPPQKIAFTPGVSTLAAAVDKMNTTLIGGTAEALDDNTIKLQTNTFDDEDGSLTVPVSGGNSSNLEFVVATDESSTSHTAAVQSLNEIGFRIPGAFGLTTSADTSDPYTDVIDTSRSFTTDDTLPGQWVKYQSGVNEDVKGVIRSIVSPTAILLHDNSPDLVSPDFLAPISIGQQYQQFNTFDLEDTDNLVVVMDDDDVNKTNNVPLSRRGRIDSAFSTTTFDGLDMDANVAGTDFSDPLWSDYDFADYKIWFKARNIVNPTNDKNAIIYRAANFGPTGERVRVTYGYNIAPDTVLSASLLPGGDYATVRILLGTDSARLTTQDGTTKFVITTGVGTTTYTWNGGAGDGLDPGFAAVSVGDLAKFNSVNFAAGNNGTFKISATDNSSYITVLSSSGVGETQILGTTSAMSVFPLIGDTGSDIVALINDTAPVNEVLEAVLTDSDPNGTTNDGFGTIDYSTLDDPAITSQYITLVDSENWIRDFSNPGSPQFTLKTPLSFINVTGGAGFIYEIDSTPVYGTTDLGEPFRLIPTTAKNVEDHFNAPTISSLSLNANIERSENGEKIQISSLLVGSQGQVEVSGGLGNSNLMAIQGNTSVDGAFLKSLVNTASSGGFHATQHIKVENQFGTKKINTFDSTTVVTTSIASPKSFTLSKRVLGVTSATDITFSPVSGNTYRATISAGPGDFLNVSIHDELQIPRETSPFLANNEGNFPIVGVDPSGTYIDFINPDWSAEVGAITLTAATDFEIATPFFTEWPKELDGTTEIQVQKLSQNVVRYRWTGTGTDPNFLTNGIRVDDTVTVGGTSFNQGNRGRFAVVGVTDDFIEVVNEDAVEETVILNEPFLSTSTITSTISVDALTFAPDYTVYSIDTPLINWGSIPPIGSRVTISGTNFDGSNQGTFMVVDSDLTSIKVANAGFTEPNIALTAITDMQFENSFTFITLDSVEAGDTLSVGAIPIAWFNEKNQGQFAISDVKRETGTLKHQIEVTDTDFASPILFSIAAPGVPGADRTSNVVTITTTANHNIATGQYVTVSGVTDSSFDGIFIVTSTPTATTFTYAQVAGDTTSGNGSVFANSNIVTLGGNVTSFLVIESTPFVTYRKIDNFMINPSNTDQHILYYSPTTHSNRISKSAGSQITALNKLGFPDTPKEGIDGYKFWTGLLRRVQRTVDGLDSDSITFPGIKASGVQLEVKPPLLQRVSIGVDVKTKSGTPLSILIDSIKSAILSYVTSLGVGEDVIMSEVVSKVQQISGVEAVIITDPAPTNNTAPERIIIQDNEKAIATENDITVG